MSKSGAISRLKGLTVPGGLTGCIEKVVDAGANIGLTPLFLAQFFPKARYICIEPSPENIALLRRNLSGMENALIIEGALAEFDGEIWFDRRDWSWDGHTSQDRPGSYKVRAVSMDSILGMANAPTIDLLKVDIENGVGKCSVIVQPPTIVVRSRRRVGPLSERIQPLLPQPWMQSG